MSRDGMEEQLRQELRLAEPGLRQEAARAQELARWEPSEVHRERAPQAGCREASCLEGMGNHQLEPPCSYQTCNCRIIWNFLDRHQDQNPGP